MSLRVAQDADRKLFAPILAHSYSFSVADVPHWLQQVGHDNQHVLEENGALVGSFFALPMGQFFGGRRVPMLGIAGVTVPIPHRGKGAGTRLMTAALRQAREQKLAISTLFPTTLTLYRRVGFERAGQRLRTAIDLRRVRLPKGRLRVEEHATPNDEVKALYRKQAASCAGHLDRSSYVWSRIEGPRGPSRRTFTFHGERGLEAYVVAAHLTKATGEGYVAVVDAATTTRRGGEAIWSLLSEYQSVAEETVFYAPPHGFMHALLPEHHYELECQSTWMLRICDPVLALRSRGYPPVSARITFLLTDEVLPESSGAYALDVSRGKPAVKKLRSGKGVRITERGLAALFSGFLSPWELRRLDLLDCTNEEAAVLAMLFAGPAPTMPDDF